jgi:hypothetical protein
MTFSFRISFRLAGVGALASTEEFVHFATAEGGVDLKLSSGQKGASIGEVDRFSVSGHGFPTESAAHAASIDVRHALLLYAAKKRTGVDLGQDSLRSFAISPYGRELLEQSLGASRILEDHLGVTVYRSDPKPTFVRMNMTATVSTQASSMTQALQETVGRFKFINARAEVAAGLYSLSHYAGRPAARFLLLFIALEALLMPRDRPESTQLHVDTLVAMTKAAPGLPQSEKDALCSALQFQKRQSIASAGRELASRLPANETYDGLGAVPFFTRIYKVRNDLVHRGLLDHVKMHSLVSEVDRFVAELVAIHAVRCHKRKTVD